MAEAAQNATNTILSAEITHLSLLVVILLILSGTFMLWLVMPTLRNFNRTLQSMNDNNRQLTVAITSLEAGIEKQTDRLEDLALRVEKVEGVVARFRRWWRIF